MPPASPLAGTMTSTTAHHSKTSRWAGSVPSKNLRRWSSMIGNSTFKWGFSYIMNQFINSFLNSKQWYVKKNFNSYNGNIILMLNIVTYNIFIPSELLKTAFWNWPLAKWKSTSNLELMRTMLIPWLIKIGGKAMPGKADSPSGFCEEQRGSHGPQGNLPLLSLFTGGYERP